MRSRLLRRKEQTRSLVNSLLWPFPPPCAIFEHYIEQRFQVNFRRIRVPAYLVCPEEPKRNETGRSIARPCRLELPADRAIDRQLAASLEEDRETQQAQQQLELEAAFEGEEAGGGFDGEHDDGELDDQGCRSQSGQQADGQQNPADEIRPSDRGLQTELGDHPRG